MRNIILFVFAIFSMVSFFGPVADMKKLNNRTPGSVMPSVDHDSMTLKPSFRVRIMLPEEKELEAFLGTEKYQDLVHNHNFQALAILSMCMNMKMS